MNSYRRLKTGLVLFVALVFFGGLASLPRLNQETFPFYSWFLFALTPQAQIKYNIRIDELALYKLEEAKMTVYYEQAGGIVGQPHSPTAHKIIQRLGAAYVRGDKAEVERQRRLLEGNFLPLPNRYTLVEIWYDPIERYRTGEQTAKELARFTGGKFE
jgi:hypothetical protein